MKEESCKVYKYKGFHFVKWGNECKYQLATHEFKVFGVLNYSLQGLNSIREAKEYINYFISEWKQNVDKAREVSRSFAQYVQSDYRVGQLNDK